MPVKKSYGPKKVKSYLNVSMKEQFYSWEYQRKNGIIKLPKKTLAGATGVAPRRERSRNGWPGPLPRRGGVRDYGRGGGVKIFCRG